MPICFMEKTKERDARGVTRESRCEAAGVSGPNPTPRIVAARAVNGTFPQAISHAASAATKRQICRTRTAPQRRTKPPAAAEDRIDVPKTSAVLTPTQAGSRPILIAAHGATTGRAKRFNDSVAKTPIVAIKGTSQVGKVLSTLLRRFHSAAT